jgi:hypothetical protein
MRPLLLIMMAASCGGASFDAVRAQTVATGQSREQVRAAMGAPDHMAKTMDHASCVEAWTYGEEPRAFVVDFDDQGRVCDVSLPK